MNQHFATIVSTMKAQILDDIHEGTVPADVKTYSQLHDYVDANMYGNWENLAPIENDEQWDALTTVVGQAQDTVNEWLAQGRPMTITDKLVGRTIRTQGPLTPFEGVVKSIEDPGTGWLKVAFEGGLTWQPRATAMVLVQQ
jgi:hypothetical protein